jgi:hypothetical protein
LAVFLPFILYWRHQIGYEGHNAEYFQIASLTELSLGLKRFFPQLTILTGTLAGALLMISFTLGALVAPLKRSNAAALVKWLGMFNVFYFLIVLFARHSYFGAGQIQRFWTAPVMSAMVLCVLLPYELLRARRLTLAGGAAVASLACLCSLAQGLVHDFPAKLPLIHVTNFERLQKLGARYVKGDFWDVFPINIISDFKMIAVPARFENARQLRPQFADAQEIFIIKNERVDLRPESWKPYVLIPTSDPGIVVAKRW